ncbi:hypothetical protein GALL_351710 [mine drainage metagenome]|uniref:Uncharacterized protein n=1 Tax=mine drainage metagenome TaxID=410659 RepID=A0A1J5QHU4_9ZZZZ
MSAPEHGPAILKLLALVEGDIDAMLDLGKRLFGEPNAEMYPLDLLAFGAIKRNLSTARAISHMVGTWNMVSARSLLRVHIDTGLRFSAAWLVDKPHEFAVQVYGGARIDKLKDQDGRRMTDSHLVEVRSNEYPWLPRVYEQLSGYIHFSGAHVFDSISEVGGEDRTISFGISPTDYKFPEFSWLEVLECTREATAMLAKYLHGYIVTKGLSPEQLATLRAQCG